MAGKKRGVVLPQERVVTELVDSMVKDMNREFSEKAILSVDDLAKFFACPKGVIYNWNRRVDVNRRPPKVTFGKEVRYQKRALALWMVMEQLNGELA